MGGFAVIILDTHIWLRWVVEGEKNIPKGIAQAIQSEDRVAVSAISCFEVAQLLKRGRIELPVSLTAWLQGALVPADRIIIATAIAHNANLGSLDGIFTSYTELTERLMKE